MQDLYVLLHYIYLRSLTTSYFVDYMLENAFTFTQLLYR